VRRRDWRGRDDQGQAAAARTRETEAAAARRTSGTGYAGHTAANTGAREASAAAYA
jgi:hypothetical protein